MADYRVPEGMSPEDFLRVLISEGELKGSPFRSSEEEISKLRPGDRVVYCGYRGDYGQGTVVRIFRGVHPGVIVKVKRDFSADNGVGMHPLTKNYLPDILLKLVEEPAREG